MHEGLGFTKWKAKQASEFDESLKINQRKIKKGVTPDYAVRGIGAEKVVEDVDVVAADGKSVVAKAGVLLVSAIFPRPTTPRDFSPLIITCEVEGGLEGSDMDRQREKGRCWMVISKPCLHEGIPPRDGYIRGQYESVEFIREVPRRTDRNTQSESDVAGHDELPPAGDAIKGRKRGKTDSDIPEKRDTQGEDEAADEDDTNPVEWIMITRSDPGGNIPRWMVEKGTPKSICSDTVKFLNWACRDGETSTEPDGTLHEPLGDEELEDSDGSESSGESGYSDIEERHNGLIANVSYMLNAGLDKFVPQAVRDYIPYHGYGTTPSDINESGDVTPTSDDNLATATKDTKQGLDPESTRPGEKASPRSSTDSGWATPPLDNTAEPPSKDKKAKPTSREKQLIKLAAQKRETVAKLETVRSEMQALKLEPASEPKLDMREEKDSQRSSEQASRASSAGKRTGASSPAASGTSSRVNPEIAQTHKAASGLFRTESKLLKQLAKIEKDQIKVAEKIQAHQRKAAEKEEKSRSRSEVDGLRREIEKLKKEVKSLRDERQKWVSLVKSLQDENEKLATKAGDGGGESK